MDKQHVHMSNPYVQYMRYDLHDLGMRNIQELSDTEVQNIHKNKFGYKYPVLKCTECGEDR